MAMTSKVLDFFDWQIASESLKDGSEMINAREVNNLRINFIERAQPFWSS